MDREDYKKYYWKVYVIIGLFAALIITWFFLFSRLQKNRDCFVNKDDPSGTPEPTAEGEPSPETTPVPTSETSPEPTAETSPEPTPQITPEETPAETAAPAPTATPKPTASPEPTATPKPTPAPTPKPTPTADTKQDLTGFDTEHVESMQYIANKNNSIPKSYVPSDLTSPNVAGIKGQKLRKEAASALEEMFAAAKKDGVNLFLVSGYRSYGEQEYLYKVYSGRNSKEYMSHLDAYPGRCEHQLGLAVDLSDTSRKCSLKACFADMDAYKWLQKNSYKYGYIERHPKDKTNATGIMYSPWGFRYIGKKQAEKVYKSGLTMEEYYGQKIS